MVVGKSTTAYNTNVGKNPKTDYANINLTTNNQTIADNLRNFKYEPQK